MHERLRRHVEALEGVRHPDTGPRKLREAEAYVAEQLAVGGVSVERRPAAATAELPPTGTVNPSSAP